MRIYSTPTFRDCLLSWEVSDCCTLFVIVVLNPIHIFAAFHGAELTYFQILNRTVQADPAAQAFSAQLMDFYLNFTVNLDPGSSWTEFSTNNPKILQLEIGNITMVDDTIRLNQTDFINSEPVVDESER